MRKSDHGFQVGIAIFGVGAALAIGVALYTIQDTQTRSFWTWPGFLSLGLVILGILLVAINFTTRGEKAATTNQVQISGENSPNVNAGRDVIMNGPSYSEVREIALNVYYDNVPQLSRVAQATAQTRAEEITEDFLSNFVTKHPQALSNLSDPDVQIDLWEIQKGYARSGEEELRKILVDLLTERASKGDRSLEVIVLNEAIVCAPKLTEGQRKAIAIIFILKYTSAKQLNSIQDYYSEYLPTYLYPLLKGCASNVIDFQHIEYVGTGAVSISSSPFIGCLKVDQDALYTKGFDEAEISNELRDLAKDKDVFIASRRDSSKIQVNNMTNSALDAFAAGKGLSSHVDELRRLADLGNMSDEEVLAEFIQSNESAQQLVDTFSKSIMNRVTLTSIGIALGHAYWKRVTGGDVPLAVWL